LGSLFLWVDYAMELEPLRKELETLCKQVPELWDGRVSIIQVTDTSDKAIQLRILVSSSNASNSWDLRCFLREKLVQFIATNHPDFLPQLRTNFSEDQFIAPKDTKPTAEMEPSPERDGRLNNNN
jgi:hypothetical protein